MRSRIGLQVALDTTDMSNAIRVAEATDGLVDRVEVGTPLLCRYGTQAIVALRSCLPNAILVVDRKLLDCGALEVELAVEAGANIVTVSAAAPRDTISAACKRATEL